TIPSSVIRSCSKRLSSALSVGLKAAFAFFFLDEGSIFRHSFSSAAHFAWSMPFCRAVYSSSPPCVFCPAAERKICSFLPAENLDKKLTTLRRVFIICLYISDSPRWSHPRRGDRLPVARYAAMAIQNKVSLPVIKRLPKYYRYLT